MHPSHPVSTTPSSVPAVILVRRLSDVRATGDFIWFQPALDCLRALRHEPNSRLRTFFSHNSPLYIARAPGRLDVMGGIADYSGGRVLELPLACATTALLQSQETPRCDIATRRGGRWHFFQIELPLATPAVLAAWFAKRNTERWASYVVGVVQHCLPGVDAGLRIVIDSTVPEGRGVASCAALEVATGAAVAAECGRPMPAAVLAAACQAVENHVVGAPCGIMDQMTSACGRRDRLLQLCCQPGTIEGYVAIPDGYRFYGIDSGISHAVAGADYGTVRTAAFMGYRMIAAAAALPAVRDGTRVRIDDARWGGYLANLTAVEFSGLSDALPEEMSGGEVLQQYDGLTDTAPPGPPPRPHPLPPAPEHPGPAAQRAATSPPR